MTSLRLFILTWASMVAFAANSVLCRFALKNSELDPASFTAIRICSGALLLYLLCLARGGGGLFRGADRAGNWRSAAALFIYAATFSFAYLSLSAGTGALVLFGAVQVTMVVAGLVGGERLTALQSAGFLLALAGLVALALPGVTAPSPTGALLMATAGVAWGAYSLLGRGNRDPIRATAGNFTRAAPLALLLGAARASRLNFDGTGAFYAVLSGAVTSGLGYVLWYGALKKLSATHAASVQLSVPVIAALGGVLFLEESPTVRLLLCSVAILGGIALVVRKR